MGFLGPSVLRRVSQGGGEGGSKGLSPAFPSPTTPKLEQMELEAARRQRDLEQRHALLLQQVGGAWRGRGRERGRGRSRLFGVWAREWEQGYAGVGGGAWTMCGLSIGGVAWKKEAWPGRKGRGLDKGGVVWTYGSYKAGVDWTKGGVVCV